MNTILPGSQSRTHAGAEYDSTCEFYRWIDHKSGRSFSMRIPLVDERFWSESQQILSNLSPSDDGLFAKLSAQLADIVTQNMLSEEDFLRVLQEFKSIAGSNISDLKQRLERLGIPNVKSITVILMLSLGRMGYQKGPAHAQMLSQSKVQTQQVLGGEQTVEDILSIHQKYEPNISSISNFDDAAPGRVVDLDVDIPQDSTTLGSFVNYLQDASLDIKDMGGRKSDIWKYLNTKKRDTFISDACANSDYFVEHEDAFAALIMTEGYGDQFIFNESDGGGGMCQIQPDVAVKDLGMTIFTSHPRYKNYDVYALLGKQHVTLDAETKSLIKKLYAQEKEKIPKKRTKSKIYRLHGLLLKHVLLTEGEDFLEQFDERFQPKKAIKAAMKHLEWTLRQTKGDSRGYLQGEGWDKIKNFFASIGVSMDQGFAINGYNKGHAKYGDNIMPKGFGTSGSKNHMANRYHNFETRLYYEKKIAESDLTGAELVRHLKSLKVSRKEYLKSAE